MLRLMLRIYFDALMKGNPFAIFLTLVWVTAISVGPFYTGVSSGDPVAIGMMIGVGVLMCILLIVVVIDRKNNQPKKRPTSHAGSSKSGGMRTGR
jgi:hypothetical protein